MPVRIDAVRCTFLDRPSADEAAGRFDRRRERNHQAPPFNGAPMPFHGRDRPGDRPVTGSSHLAKALNFYFRKAG